MFLPSFIFGFTVGVALALAGVSIFETPIKFLILDTAILVSGFYLAEKYKQIDSEPK